MHKEFLVRDWLIGILLLAQLSGSAGIGRAADVQSPASTAPTVVKTLARIDAKHPLRIGQEFYPKESLRLREEGRCYIDACPIHSRE
jgi:hypothetical protein